ncbi:MAG: hypothetical protein F4Z96_00545 [Chloroflexi bacterium]|nr:hypothetical protein [Chloroflexota bacterium]
MPNPIPSDDAVLPQIDYDAVLPKIDYDAIVPATAETSEANGTDTSMVAKVSAELWLHDASWAEMWDGAVYALGNRGPDFPRHVASSLRSLLWAVRDEFAPRQVDESDRARFIRLLESRSRGRLAASASSLADELLGRLSSLAKEPNGRADEAESAVWLTGGLLRLILPD